MFALGHSLFSLRWLSALLQHFYWPLSNFSDFRLVNWTFKVAASQNYHHHHSPHWTLVSVGGCQLVQMQRSLSHCRPSFFPSSLPFPFPSSLTLLYCTLLLHRQTLICTQRQAQLAGLQNFAIMRKVQIIMAAAKLVVEKKTSGCPAAAAAALIRYVMYGFFGNHFYSSFFSAAIAVAAAWSLYFKS